MPDTTMPRACRTAPYPGGSGCFVWPLLKSSRVFDITHPLKPPKHTSRAVSRYDVSRQLLIVVTVVGLVATDLRPSDSMGFHG